MDFWPPDRELVAIVRADQCVHFPRAALADWAGEQSICGIRGSVWPFPEGVPGGLRRLNKTSPRCHREAAALCPPPLLPM